ncbi:hypothetical protein ACLKA6_004413 [Drosophila palustris]
MLSHRLKPNPNYEAQADLDCLAKCNPRKRRARTQLSKPSTCTCWHPSSWPRHLPCCPATDKRGQQHEGHSVVRLRHFAVTFFYLTTRRAIASRYSYRGH